MGLHNQIVIGILKSAIANSRAKDQCSNAKKEDAKQDSPISDYQFDRSNSLANLYTYIISFCIKNIEYHQEHEDLHTLQNRVMNWLKTHPYESKLSNFPEYPRVCTSFLNARYSINPNSFSCSEFISLPPHISIQSFKDPLQTIPSNELSKAYVEESLQIYSSILSRETPLIPSNVMFVLPFLLYITYHCHSSSEFLQSSSIPCFSLRFFLLVGTINALSLVNFSTITSRVELIFKWNHKCYKKGVTKCIALATNIFLMRILLLIWKFLFVNDHENRVVVDSALLKRILHLFPAFLGPIQQECMDKLAAFPPLMDPKIIKEK